MARRGRGEGTVYRRADGRWEAAFSFGGRRQRYVGRSQRDVRLKLTAARRALEQGIVLSGSSQRVEEYLARWLEDSVRPSVRWTTHRAYALCMRRLFPLVGHLRLVSLTPQAVQAAYAALLTKGLSRRSVEQTHTVLHRALRQAVLWGLMLRNPTEAVTVPRPTQREMHTLTEEEVGRLFEDSGSSPACAVGAVGHHRAPPRRGPRPSVERHRLRERPPGRQSRTPAPDRCRQRFRRAQDGAQPPNRVPRTGDA